MARYGNEVVARFQRYVGVCDDGLFGKNTLRAACNHFHMGPDVGAHFFGQISVETCNFTQFSENLNYSKAGLLRTFPRYFTEEEAGLYARNPKAIANRVYANRLGNGNEESGDGWRYRGRGAIQLTGKWNYENFWKWYTAQTQESVCGLSIIYFPERVVEDLAFTSAIYYFETRKLFDTIRGISLDEITRVSKIVNGGIYGLEQRIKKTQEYYKILVK